MVQILQNLGELSRILDSTSAGFIQQLNPRDATFCRYQARKYLLGLSRVPDHYREQDHDAAVISGLLLSSDKVIELCPRQGCAEKSVSIY